MKLLYLKKIIKETNLFDEELYISIYQDVKLSGMDPIYHYLTYGYKEGRIPSLKFNPKSYIETYQDVKQSGINPLLHYILYGKNEGRKAFEDFNIKSIQFKDDILEALYKEEKLILGGFKNRSGAADIYFDIASVFFYEDYKFLNVGNESVIDIGANICDSSIYFALNGARRVIALEPQPVLYNTGCNNIRLNNLDDKIVLLNAGYGEVKINKNFKISIGNASGDLSVYSLKRLIEEFNIDEGILKIDCEGCEYNLLEESEEILKKFKQIQIEYHYGYNDLKKKLEDCGFSVNVTEPVSFKSDSDIKLGYLYASIAS